MQQDKKIHIGAGFLIALVVGFIFGSETGLMAALIAGIAKEVWDYFGHGTCELNDFLATLQGGIAGFILLLIIKYFS